MYEHPSYIHNTILVEQERIDRENELRRIITENPDRVIRRRGSVLSRVSGWFRTRQADAAASVVAADSPRAICDTTARPAHAR
ncbi:hypothetical protein [Microbacterium abyssi]|uniref:hypothetical protein n=1 Tax=Microbacterium abyssi TaxID=2782166 RepID=UPI001888B27B|nr:hypothetical protein [Microbacterium sp. A18JL241]